MLCHVVSGIFSFPPLGWRQPFPQGVDKGFFTAIPAEIFLAPQRRNSTAVFTVITLSGDNNLSCHSRESGNPGIYIVSKKIPDSPHFA